MLPVVFQHVKTVDFRDKLISKLYQHFREHGLPYGLQDSLCTLTSHVVRGLPRSSLRSTLDTGGWPTLTRRGLAPRKIRRASSRRDDELAQQLARVTPAGLALVTAFKPPLVSPRLASWWWERLLRAVTEGDRGELQVILEHAGLLTDG